MITTGYPPGFSAVNPPFSADVTPTSAWTSSGLFGSGIGPAGSFNYLPPPDITGYTYGDYATPNYGNPPAAPVPQPSLASNALNPVGSVHTNNWLTYGAIGAGLVGVILIGHLFDKRGRRK